MIQGKKAYYLHFYTFCRKCGDLLTASGFPIFPIFSSLCDVTYSIVEQLHKFRDGMEKVFIFSHLTIKKFASSLVLLAVNFVELISTPFDQVCYNSLH